MTDLELMEMEKERYRVMLLKVRKMLAKAPPKGEEAEWNRRVIANALKSIREVDE
jgi:hypothetical protein